ncbi:MAG: acyl-CoA dehydrogenase family protein [Pseudomonadota bacterium]
MQLALTAEQLSFRDSVREFLARELPSEFADKMRRGEGLAKAETIEWTRRLAAQGWAAPAWPVEHGGTGWSLVQRHIFDVECRLAHAPYLSGFGFTMVGPAIARFGTPEQQREHLPKIINSERWWCQGYSEPGAGSDLAGLATRAERDGDEYVVNGSKIWTSGAEQADWIFCLVRTDPKVQKQKGISFLLFDLDTPGVRIEPLYAFNGKRLWNQVFFDDVRVPIENRLGEENRGWTVAKSLLGDERLMVSRVAENKRMLSLIGDALAGETDGGAALDQLGHYRRAMDELDVRLQALEMTSLRLLSQADSGAEVGAEPSMLKLKGSELVQAMDELLFDAAGQWVLPRDRTTGTAAAAPVGPDWAEYIASGRYHHRGYTIAGGSSEVQHNIIAKAVLGL